MKPSEVPGDLLDAACDQMYGTPPDPGDDRDAMALALAAVLPEHRRQVLREEANALWDEIERQVRADERAKVLSLWPPDDTDDDALVQSIGAYLRGICHVCEEPLTAEPCTPRHSNLARGEWKRDGA